MYSVSRAYQTKEAYQNKEKIPLIKKYYHVNGKITVKKGIQA